MKLSKKILIIAAVIFSLCILSSCDKSSNEPENPQSKVYYVKYELSQTSSWPGIRQGNVNVILTTEKGTQQLVLPSSWEGVFGPFTDLKELELSARIDNSDYTSIITIHGRISVSVENSPFGLKAEGNSKNPFYLSYRVTEQDIQ